MHPFKWRSLMGAVLLGGITLWSATYAREIEDRKQLLITGKAALEDGLYEIAEKVFERYVVLSSDRADKAEGSLFLARAVFGLRRYEETIELLTSRRGWAEGLPVAAGFTYWTARALVERGRVQEALDRLEDFKRQYPKSAYLLQADRLRIKCYLQLQKYDEALDTFRILRKNYADSSQTPEILLEWAGTLISMGKGDQAQKMLEQLIAEYPQSDPASRGRLWLAELFIQQQKMEMAIDTLTVLTRQEEANSERRASAWFALARIYESQTNLTGAIDALDSASTTTRDPAVRSQGIIARGKLLIRTGRLEEGLALLKDFVKANASDPMAGSIQLDLAQSLLDRESYDQALEEFQHYLEAFSDEEGQVKALLGKGWSLWGLQRHAEAASAFEKASSLASDPQEKATALIKAADACFANNQYKLARDKYRRVAAEYPDNPIASQALYQAAECLAQLRELANADEEFKNFAAARLKDPLAEKAALRVASLKEEQGEWDQAVGVYEQYLMLFRNGVLRGKALHGRGLIRYRQGLFKEALEDFEQVIEKFPDSDVVEQDFFMRGWCLYLMGRDQEALAVCRQFIEKYPESSWAADVLFWLGEYYYNHGNYAEAEQQFAGLAQRYPEGPLAENALFWAARSAGARKEYLQAIEFLNTLIKNYPAGPKLAEARFAQGDAMSELGQFSGAILAFEEIIAKFPKSYLVDLAWGRKGDCQFTLGKDDPKRYQEALVSYRMVLDSPTADNDLKWQAEFKIGRCKEKMGQPDEAMEHYMNVVYDYLLARERGAGDSSLWFTRAAFNAAAIKEAEGKWREAVNIYRRVVDAEVPAAGDAQERMKKIRFEHWVLF